ncbi:MAG: DUF4258 domain-containing protein [Candidatus Solibacter usitatus]|nr:DUF4258 domain-containing protein [Candidatus Solibacter usitatus]
MDCQRLVLSGHAIRRMFERGIGLDDLREAVSNGETVGEYPDDLPFPSRLILAFVNRRPIHVVVALVAEAATCIVVTVYEPNSSRWNDDYKTRRLK